MPLIFSPDIFMPLASLQRHYALRALYAIADAPLTIFFFFFHDCFTAAFAIRYVIDAAFISLRHVMLVTLFRRCYAIIYVSKALR